MDTIKEISTENSTTQKSSESRFRANFQGEVDEAFDPYLVLSQLIDPDPNKPAFLTGLRLPSVDYFGFRSPYDISTIIEPFDETNNQVNLTPKYSFVDLHTGRSISLIALMITLQLILEKTMVRTDCQQ
jgi:hypothetical protein